MSYLASISPAIERIAEAVTMRERQATGAEADMEDTAKFEASLKARLLVDGAVKEMDFARAKRVEAEQLEDESLSALLICLGVP